MFRVWLQAGQLEQPRKRPDLPVRSRNQPPQTGQDSMGAPQSRQRKRSPSFTGNPVRQTGHGGCVCSQ